MASRSSYALELAHLATSQHGVVARHQLLGLGMSDHVIRGLVRAGRLHRTHAGVYAVGHAAVSPLGRLMAAHLAGGPSSAISHITAACEWRISRIHSARVHLLVTRNHRGLDGVLVRRTRHLPGWHTTRRQGIRRTGVARTIIDLTDELTPWQLTNVLNEASRRGLLNLGRVERLMIDCRGRHGLARVRHAIEMHRAGSAGTKSDLEDLCLAHMLGAGIEAPLVNVGVAFPGRAWELDFHWPAHRLNVEVDGGTGHLVPYRSAKDRIRDAELERAGWTVLRFTRDQVRYEAATVTATIRAILAAT